MEAYQVTVLEKDLAAVYALLAELNKESGSSGAPSAEIEQAIEVPNNGTWTQKELAAVHERCKPRHRAIVDRIATTSLNGDEAGYSELIEVAGPLKPDPSTYGFTNLRADLAWISKYSKAVKDGEHVWPIAVNTQGESITYRMPRQIAEWWLDLGGGTV